MDTAWLKQQLARQLLFIRRSSLAFDAGYRDEAVRIATHIRIMIHQTPKSTSLLIILPLFITAVLSVQGCDNPKTEYRKHALRYFYGWDNAGVRTAGKMISSYEEKQRNAAIELRKTIYGLTEEWTFLNEDIRVIEITETEFLIVYTTTFGHRDNNHYYNIEEHYYSVPDVYYDPVPLKVSEIKASSSPKGGHMVRERTLWHGDFDAYLGRHLKKSVFPE